MPGDKLKIKISDFCSLKKVEFEIEKGINLVVGKNGSGKSQLLMAIANRYGSLILLEQNGFDKHNINQKTVLLDPVIQKDKIFWRPPVRRIAEDSREHEFANSESTESYINHSVHFGYTSRVDERYKRLYNRLANFYLAGTNREATVSAVTNWDLLSNSFKVVFKKELIGNMSTNGIKIGLKLEGNNISRFNTLSTGELEFISLLLDIITETDIELFLFDEIDTHFHPDLQQKIIGLISEFLKEKYVLITTHSPALMLSVDPDRIFYLKPKEEVEPEENQISVISSDYQLLESVTGLYAGFSTDIRMHDLFSNAFYQTTLRFAEECTHDSGVKEPSSEDCDPQVSFIRTWLIGNIGDKRILEIGIGKGRLLNAFKAISQGSNLSIQYYGIDPIEENLEKANNFFQSQRFPIISNPIQLKSDLKSLILDEASIDLCILANVLHEISPDKLEDLFNQIFLKLKNQAKICILEQLELPHGEKEYLMFHGEAINKIFQQLKSSRHISIVEANPISHGNKPLLELIITIENKEQLVINKNDILAGIEEVITYSCDQLKSNLINNNLSLLQFSFYSHNLANAVVYKELLN